MPGKKRPIQEEPPGPLKDQQVRERMTMRSRQQKNTETQMPQTAGQNRDEKRRAGSQAEANEKASITNRNAKRKAGTPHPTGAANTAPTGQNKALNTE